MNKVFTCIICPRGCEITANLDVETNPTFVGAGCSRGESYVKEELTNPVRTISSSVCVRQGEMPLVSVRLTNPIPKKMIFEVMQEIRNTEVSAPVAVGDVVISNILGLNSDVIVTKNVAVK